MHNNAKACCGGNLYCIYSPTFPPPAKTGWWGTTLSASSTAKYFNQPFKVRTKIKPRNAQGTDATFLKLVWQCKYSSTKKCVDIYSRFLILKGHIAGQYESILDVLLHVRVASTMVQHQTSHQTVKSKSMSPCALLQSPSFKLSASLLYTSVRPHLPSQSPHLVAVLPFYSFSVH